MSDEQDKRVLGAVDDGQTAEEQGVVDPWAAAFGTIEEKAAQPDSRDTPEASPEPAGGDSVPEQGIGTGVGEIDAPVGSRDVGGPDVPAGDGGGEDAGAGYDVEAVVKEYEQNIERQAIEDTVRLFLERADENGNKLIRQTNGQLGATINDPDIYRVDPETGRATFYNPDTGRPFTGDNPRAQAKAWVEEYNEELRDTFNRMAAQREAELAKKIEPVVNLLKFAPKYEKLDPVRQKMLDALIEDYEVYDESGAHIGYSIDLDKALDRVNKQVALIKQSKEAAALPQKQPTGPALDMKTSSGGAPDGKRITSLADALEAKQDEALAKLRSR